MLLHDQIEIDFIKQNLFLNQECNKLENTFPVPVFVCIMACIFSNYIQHVQFEINNLLNTVYK